jgi:hypothetical protein
LGLLEQDLGLFKHELGLFKQFVQKAAKSQKSVRQRI